MELYLISIADDIRHVLMFASGCLAAWMTIWLIVSLDPESPKSVFLGYSISLAILLLVAFIPSSATLEQIWFPITNAMD